MENNIICISSDEETKPLKKNKRNTASSFKLPNESVFIRPKEEVTHDNQTSIVNKLKRKRLLADNKPIPNSSDKRMKLSSSNEESKYLINESEQLYVRLEKKQIKPKLVVKEKKSVDQEKQDVFPMFLSLCLQKERNDDMKIIIAKLKRNYERMDPIYAKSEQFIDFVNVKRNAIMSNNKRLYVNILDVMNEMKSKRKHHSKIISLNDTAKNDTCGTSPLTLNQTNSKNSLPEGTIEMDHENAEYEDNVNPRTRKKLIQLTRTMKQCEKKIKSLEEIEVNFDDEDNSNYLKLDRYKTRMVELYNEYCELTGENADAGRQYLRPKDFITTHFDSIDKEIRRFINSNFSKIKRSKKIGAFVNDLIFPDYRDILSCVSKGSDKLKLNKKEQEQIAEKAFTDLGKYLQRLRHLDFWDTFSMFLDNQDEDPAIGNMELAEKLQANRQVGEKKLSTVFEEYVKKQEEMKNKLDTTVSSDDNDEEEDEEDDEDEEDEEEEEDEEDEEEEEEAVAAAAEVVVRNKEDGKDGKRRETEDVNTGDKTVNENSEMIRDIDDDTKINEKTVISVIDDMDKTTKNTVQSKENSQEHIVDINDEKDNDDVVLISDMTITEDKKLDIENKLLLDTKTNLLDNTNIKLQNEEKIKETTERMQLCMLDSGKTTNGTEDDVAELVSKDHEYSKQIEECKSFIRVRSFAKSPITWQDGQQKSQENMQKVTKMECKKVIDLTNEELKQDITSKDTMVQVGGKTLPILNGECKASVEPANSACKSIIKVKNMTNNYVKLNAKDIDINTTSSLKDIQRLTHVPIVRQIVDVNRQGTVIRIPSFKKQVKYSDAKNSRVDWNETFVRILQPKKGLIIPKTLASTDTTVTKSK